MGDGDSKDIRNYFSADGKQQPPEAEDSVPDIRTEADVDNDFEVESKEAKDDVQLEIKQEVKDGAEIDVEGGSNFIGWTLRYYSESEFRWREGTVVKWVGPGEYVFELKDINDNADAATSSRTTQPRRRSSRRRAQQTASRIVDLNQIRFNVIGR